METCVLLSARRYDFKDDAGKQVEGVTLTYITENVETEGDTRGCQPLSVAGASSVWSKLGAVPGIYDLDFKQRPGPKGKPTLQLVDVKFKEALELGFGDVPKP
jgi:hypothetical protein